MLSLKTRARALRYVAIIGPSHVASQVALRSRALQHMRPREDTPDFRHNLRCLCDEQLIAPKLQSECTRNLLIIDSLVILQYGSYTA